MSVGTKFCPSCGKSVAFDARFCPSCGATLVAQQPAPAPGYPTYQAPYQTTPAKSNTTMIIAIIVIVVIVVAVIGGILAIGFFNALSTATAWHSQNVVNGLITVPAGSYEYYQLSVSSAVTSIVVNGTFTASGGSGNNIDVLVMDQTNFVNWKNGNTGYAIYDSGQVTTGTVSASLTAGTTYDLVYSNTFSTVSSKNVQTAVNLYYQG